MFNFSNNLLLNTQLKLLTNITSNIFSRSYHLTKLGCRHYTLEVNKKIIETYFVQTNNYHRSFSFHFVTSLSGFGIRVMVAS